MTDPPPSQEWKEHLQRHKKTTDKPACLYCAGREIQSDTNSLKDHIRTKHPGKEITLTTFNQDDSLPCIFHLMMGCNVSFPERGEKAWRSHIISHFPPTGPPKDALCIFCDEEFHRVDPRACWDLFFNHTFHHLTNGQNIASSRPIFATLKYLYEYGRMSKEDFDHCMNYTERPTVDGLRPYDYEPSEITKKKESDQWRANSLVLDDRRERRAFTKYQQRERKEKSSSQPNNPLPNIINSRLERPME